MLEVLGTLHDAGVVHGDLKPSNVYTLADRPEVVLLDLGLASGRALARALPGNRFAGTPSYAAPELLSGPCDHRVDLYAVGVMVYHALTNEVPLHASHPLVMVARRGREESPPVRQLAPDTPSEVASLVDALLAIRPEDRPSSAWEALERLGGRTRAPLTQLRSLPEGRADREFLMGLFHGPDAFLHLREDAARVLHDRTGGHPLAIEEELAAWLRAGLCRWEDGALRIERMAIARLEAREALGEALLGSSSDLVRLISLAYPYATAPGLSLALGRDVQAEVEGRLATGEVWSLPTGLGARPARALGLPEAGLLRSVATALPAHSPGRVELLFRGGASLGELVEALGPVVADGSLEPERALALIQPLLARARAEEDSGHILELLAHWCSFTLMQEAAGPVERAIFEVQRAQAEGVQGPVAQQLQSIELLLRASLAYFSGRLGDHESQLGGLPPFRWDELEAWRCALKVEIARSRGTEAWGQAIGALRPWAELSVDRQARLDGWEANRLYRMERYREAAELHERAAQRKAWLNGRLSSLRNAASAWMEAGEYGQAVLLSSQVRSLAEDARLARFEAMAVWSERSARSRMADGLVARPDLVDAAFAVDTLCGALMAFTEGVTAWKTGQYELGVVLSKRAHGGFERKGIAHGCTLARLVSVLCRPETAGLDEIEALLDETCSGSSPRVQVQVMGLLGQSLGRTDLMDRARALAKASFTPGLGWAMEMGSLEEILNLDGNTNGAET